MGNILKYLKLLPFLIAAAFCMPRAQAAESVQPESGHYGAALVCVGLVILRAAANRRTPAFKPHN
jgi:hypothetical protein